MMDASVSLMNQYTLIASRFPNPNPNPQPAPTPTASTSTSTSTSSTDEVTSTTPTTVDTANVDPVTTISTNENSEDAGPSTSQASNHKELPKIDENLVTIEDIGRDDESESHEVSVLRQRRLEKFDRTKAEAEES